MCQEWDVIYFAEDYDKAVENERLHDHRKFLTARMTATPRNNGVLQMCPSGMDNHRPCPQENRHRQGKNKSKWYAEDCQMTEYIVHLIGVGQGPCRYFFQRMATPLSQSDVGGVMDLFPVAAKKRFKHVPTAAVGDKLPWGYKRSFSPSMHNDKTPFSFGDLPSAETPKEKQKNEQGISLSNTHVGGGLEIIVGNSVAPVNASPCGSPVREPKHIDSDWVMV